MHALTHTYTHTYVHMYTYKGTCIHTRRRGDIKNQSLYYYRSSCRTELGTKQAPHPCLLGDRRHRYGIQDTARDKLIGDRLTSHPLPRLTCTCSGQQSLPSGVPAQRPRTCAGSQASRSLAMASAQKPPPDRQLFEKPEVLPHTLPTEKGRLDRERAECREPV